MQKNMQLLGVYNRKRYCAHDFNTTNHYDKLGRDKNGVPLAGAPLVGII